MFRLQKFKLQFRTSRCFLSLMVSDGQDWKSFLLAHRLTFSPGLYSSFSDTLVLVQGLRMITFLAHTLSQDDGVFTRGPNEKLWTNLVLNLVATFRISSLFDLHCFCVCLRQQKDAKQQASSRAVRREIWYSWISSSRTVQPVTEWSYFLCNVQLVHSSSSYMSTL